MSSAAVGAFLAWQSSPADAAYDIRSDVSPMHALAGSFLVVLGGRVASGCTSGHGMTGIGHLVNRSLVAVASMFAAGIATTALLY